MLADSILILSMSRLKAARQKKSCAGEAQLKLWTSMKKLCFKSNWIFGKMLLY